MSRQVTENEIREIMTRLFVDGKTSRIATKDLIHEVLKVYPDADALDVEMTIHKMHYIEKPLTPEKSCVALVKRHGDGSVEVGYTFNSSLMTRESVLVIVMECGSSYLIKYKDANPDEIEAVLNGTCPKSTVRVSEKAALQELARGKGL